MEPETIHEICEGESRIVCQQRHERVALRDFHEAFSSRQPLCINVLYDLPIAQGEPLSIPLFDRLDGKAAGIDIEDTRIPRAVPEDEVNGF